MKSKTALLGPKNLFAVCLSLNLLTACANSIPVSPGSSSAILKDTSAEVALKICEGLKPEILSAQEEVDVLTLNYSARAGKVWERICT